MQSSQRVLKSLCQCCIITSKFYAGLSSEKIGTVTCNLKYVQVCKCFVYSTELQMNFEAIRKDTYDVLGPVCQNAVKTK